MVEGEGKTKQGFVGMTSCNFLVVAIDQEGEPRIFNTFQIVCDRLCLRDEMERVVERHSCVAARDV